MDIYIYLCYRSVVKCFICMGESVTYREFTNLTLPLPENSNR